MNYNQFNPKSKVWIYQSNREFNDHELAEIKLMSNHFVADWNSHGNKLYATIEVFYNRFIVLFVDENFAATSGCSIDKSVAFIKNLEQHFNINLLDRFAVAYLINDELKTTHLNDFQKQIEVGIIDNNTIVFNNLITTKEEFDTNWKIPLNKSWHKRLVNV